MHTLLATGPVITGTYSPDTTTWWMFAMLIAGLFGGIATFIWSLESSGESGVPLILAATVSLGLLFGGAVLVNTNLGHDNRTVGMENLAAAVSDRYALDQITLSEDSGDSADTAKALCGPVSPDSPEMAGVNEGRQITFKVGLQDCEDEDPVAEVIVTGLDISAEDLKKEPA